MGKRLYDVNTGATASVGKDAVGNFVMKANGKKEYALTTAITQGATTTAVAGSLATTSHATGGDKLWISVNDSGLKWKAITFTA